MATEDILATAKIDPELEELLERNGPVPPLGGEIHALRARLIAQKKALTAGLSSGPPAAVHEFEHAVPGRDGHTIPVRIYKPKNPPSSGSPLIIIFHGGGFALGGFENEELNCRRFVETYGAVVLNVAYRLAPEHPFPAAPNDAWDVTAWAAANARGELLSAAPEKGFIIGGTSAGGNLTDVVAHLAAVEKLNPPLTGLLLMIPALMPHDHVPEKYKPQYHSWEQNRHAAVLPVASVEYFEEHYKPDFESPLAAPFIHPAGHGGIPPVYFQVCGMDPLRDDAVIYEQVLREEYGQKTKLVMYKGLPHGFFSMFPMLKSTKRFVDDTLAGIGWLLENGRPAVKV